MDWQIKRFWEKVEINSPNYISPSQKAVARLKNERIAKDKIEKVEMEKKIAYLIGKQIKIFSVYTLKNSNPNLDLSNLDLYGKIGQVDGIEIIFEGNAGEYEGYDPICGCHRINLIINIDGLQLKYKSKFLDDFINQNGDRIELKKYKKSVWMNNCCKIGEKHIYKDMELRYICPTEDQF
jgi:hypothetical protein